MGRGLFVVHQLVGGGAERQLVTLAKGLQQRGHSIAIATFRPGGPYVADLDGTGVELICLNKSKVPILGSVGYFRRLERLINRWRPDVIYGFLETGNVAVALRRLWGRNARTVFGVRASDLELTQYDWYGRLIASLNRPLSRLADLIIANSRAGATHAISRGYPASKTVAVPNGIDIVRFVPDEEGRKRVRALFGAEADHKVIGAVARLDPMKGHKVFLEAARILAGRRPDVRFVWAGEGVEPYQAPVLRDFQASGLGDRFRHLGFQRDVTALYSAFDVGTSPSLFGEGFSNAVAECMACGVPCVVTRVGDSADIVGDLGIVVPPGDPAALAAAWEALLGRLGPELSVACRQRIAEHFSVERLVSSTERLLWPAITSAHTAVDALRSA